MVSRRPFVNIACATGKALSALRRRLALKFFLLAVLAASPAFSRVISTNEAGRTAAAWVRRDSRPLGVSIAPDGVAEVRTTAGDDGAPLFHAVRMAGGGVVVTSAESGVAPVVAFFDGDVAPDDNPIWKILRADMSNRTEQVKAVRAASTRRAAKGAPLLKTTPDPFAAEEAAWAALLAEDAEQSATKGAGLLKAASVPDASDLSDLRVAPLVSTAWAQEGNAANYYTPPGDAGDPGNYCCGCVALAGAQVANFWQFPTASRPQVTKTCYVSDAPTNFTTLGGTYDWNNMPSDYSSLSDVQKQSVGRLCYDMGVATMMNWRQDGSGTMGNFLAPAFIEVFGYAGAKCYFDTPDGAMSDKIVEKTVLANLDAGCPVCISIAGHEVVADGYGYASGTLYTHVNLGWGGMADAWYNLPEVDARPYGVDYTSTVLEQVVYNIHPTETGELLTGRVLDGNGDPVSGATVTATNGTNTVAGTTNERGIYALWVDGGKFWTAVATSGGASGLRSAYVGAAVSGECLRTVGGGIVRKFGIPGNCWGNDITLGVDIAIPSLGEALNAPRRTFQTGGDAVWIPEADESHDGEAAAQSTLVDDNQSTWLETVVLGPGKVSFWWNVSSEKGCDFLRFYVDDKYIYAISGTTGTWEYVEFEVDGKGAHAFGWEYSKDWYGSRGADCGWVDEVSWTPVGDLHVDASTGDDANDGTSWSAAKASIQAAIDVASEGAAIFVNDGRYAPISTANKAISIYSVNGPDFTIIDGGATNRCATLGEHNETNTCLYAFCLTNGAALHGGGSYGGTLENCLISGNTARSSGGGALGGCLKDCTIVGNTANYGGGVYEGSLVKCSISGNSAGSSGGGTDVATLDRCVIENNTAGDYGGGVSYGYAIDCTIADNSSPYGGGVYGGNFDYCFINGNEATKEGGGAAAGTLNNCIIWKNVANNGGGAYFAWLNNCTIVGNEATSAGGGASSATLTNCIVRGNTQQRDISTCGSASRYCCLDEMVSGEGNIVADPLFVDAANGDFRLRPGSPCINAGANDAASAYIDGTDYYYYPRLSGGRIDIGVAEALWEYPVWAAANGLGAPDDVTDGQPNLIRYVFDRPSGAFSPFTGLTFQDGNPVLTFQSFNPEIYGVSMSIVSTTNLLDWTHAEALQLRGPFNFSRLIIYHFGSASQRFYRLKVDE